MSARRQSSQSSLSRYQPQAGGQNMDGGSLEFCNSFWGLNDAGVEVLFARMRIAAKTVDDLRAFWRERAAIEDEYAKRLIKLSKQPLGQGEVGELKNALDVVRQETERQAGQHLTLSISIRRELEQSASEFATKQANHKKTYQSSVEKTFKQKQLNETYVAKAKERYEQDCHRVNAYTAQQSLVQGRDLDKVTLKLERAQSTVETNRRDYQNFTRALADTVARWDSEWKAFCDQCQDLEEERLEFMKDNVWAYANHVSTVCVNEDESCEAMRVSLERLEVERDIEYFITHHGTGPAIPEAPPFINYTASEPTPLKPETRPANFARSSTRPQSYMGLPPPAPEEEPVDAGNAGRGAVHARNNSRGQIGPNETGNSSQSSQLPPISSVSPTLPPIATSAPNLGYHQTNNSIGSSSNQGAYSQTMPALSSNPSQSGRRGSYQPPIETSSSTELAIGSKSYKVDLNKDPQSTLGGPDDPIASQIARLRAAPAPSESVRRGGTIGKNSVQSHQPPSSNHGSVANHSSTPSISALSPPGASVDYHSQADAVVGAHPSSRPSSPALAAPGSVPHAAMMQPNRARSTSPLPVEQVLSTYGQAFPGERPASRNNSINTQNRGRPVENNMRPVSPGGFAGVGAHSRSPSPQPIRRNASPGPGQIVSPQQGFNQAFPGPERKTASPAMQASGSVRRAGATSPTAVGIKLDASGNVAHDSMAEQFRSTSNYAQQQQQRPPQQQQQQAMQQPSQPMQQTAITAPKPSNPYAQQPQWNSYPQMQQPPPANAPTPSNVNPNQPNQWSGFTAPPPAPPPLNNQPPQQQQAGYGYAQPAQPGMATSPSMGYGQLQYGGPPQQQQQQQQQPMGPPQHTGSEAYRGAVTSQYAMPVQGQNMGGMPQQQQLQQMGPQPPPQQQMQTPQQMQSVPPQNQMALNPATNGRAPSPLPPTGNFIEDRGILFYVKALYDYTATIEEEFDFQAGDVIAVLATPDDGWWQGILLDDSRRQPGRTVFPSNFVCLF